MTPDMDKYLPMVEDYDLPDAEKRELILAVWSIMEAFVDRAFGMDPTTIALDSPQQGNSSSKDTAGGLESVYNRAAMRAEPMPVKEDTHDAKSSYLRPRFKR